MSEETHCPTCTCGRRAPVQADHRGVRNGRGSWTIAWSEHVLAWGGYARRYGRDQTAERLAERGVFPRNGKVRAVLHEKRAAVIVVRYRRKGHDSWVCYTSADWDVGWLRPGRAPKVRS